MPTSKFAAALLGMCLLLPSAPAAVLLSDFSDLAGTSFTPFGLSWSGGSPETDQFSQGAGFVSIIPVGGGNPLGDGNFYSVLSGTTDLPGPPQDFSLLPEIQVTARIDGGNGSGGFILTLVDSDFTDVGSAVFSVELFGPAFSTASAMITLSGEGSLANIQYFRLSGDGGFSAFRMSFDQAVAVPEPSAAILAGLAGLFAAGRRRAVRVS
jgi:hypothetical protein